MLRCESEMTAPASHHLTLPHHIHRLFRRILDNKSIWEGIAFGHAALKEPRTGGIIVAMPTLCGLRRVTSFHSRLFTTLTCLGPLLLQCGEFDAIADRMSTDPRSLFPPLPPRSQPIENLQDPQRRPRQAHRGRPGTNRLCRVAEGRCRPHPGSLRCCQGDRTDREGGFRAATKDGACCRGQVGA